MEARLRSVLKGEDRQISLLPPHFALANMEIVGGTSLESYAGVLKGKLVHARHEPSCHKEQHIVENLRRKERVAQ